MSDDRDHVDGRNVFNNFTYLLVHMGFMSHGDWWILDLSEYAERWGDEDE